MNHQLFSSAPFSFLFSGFSLSLFFCLALSLESTIEVDDETGRYLNISFWKSSQFLSGDILGKKIVVKEYGNFVMTTTEELKRRVEQHMLLEEEEVKNKLKLYYTDSNNSQEEKMLLDQDDVVANFKKALNLHVVVSGENLIEQIVSGLKDIACEENRVLIDKFAPQQNSRTTPPVPVDVTVGRFSFGIKGVILVVSVGVAGSLTLYYLFFRKDNNNKKSGKKRNLAAGPSLDNEIQLPIPPSPNKK